MILIISVFFFIFAKTESYLLYQDVSHGLDVFVSIICVMNMILIISVFFFIFAKTESYLLYQDVSHGLDVFVSIIWRNTGLVTARV